MGEVRKLLHSVGQTSSMVFLRGVRLAFHMMQEYQKDSRTCTTTEHMPIVLFYILE